MMFCIACVSTQSNQLKIQQLAEHGDAGAQYDLGWKYFKGEGVPKDDVQAVAWFRKAADQGDADAQYTLGAMYGLGKGVAMDVVQSYMWIELAANQGHAKAIDARKKITEVLTTSQIEEGQRLSREWSAAHHKSNGQLDLELRRF